MAYKTHSTVTSGRAAAAARKVLHGPKRSKAGKTAASAPPPNTPNSATGLRVAGSLTMADVKAFERKAADWERRVTKDRQSARAALVRMGIITRHGRLAKRYSN